MFSYNIFYFKKDFLNFYCKCGLLYHLSNQGSRRGTVTAGSDVVCLAVTAACTG